MAQIKYILLIIFLQVILMLEWGVEARTNNTKSRKPSIKRSNRTRNTTVSSPFLRSLTDLDSSTEIEDTLNELELLPLFEDFDDFSSLALIDQVDNLFDPLSSAAFPPSSSIKYLTSNVCGKQLYCRGGARGPCQRNEVFTQTEVIKTSSCMNFVSSSWNGCFPASSSKVTSLISSSSIASGGCTLRFPKIPCLGYPSTYRYCRWTKRCYPCANENIGITDIQLSSGPCEADKIFVDMDGLNGVCHCRIRNYLLFKGDNKCHRIYTKGPCKVGYWLEAETNGYGVCRPSLCPADKCDGLHIFWRSTPRSKGGCFKSFSRGPCQSNSYFLIEDYVTKSGRCVSRYGSSFSSLSYYSSRTRYRRFPVWNSYSSLYSNQDAMSPWSHFGAYPPLDLFNFLDDGFDDYYSGSF